MLEKLIDVYVRDVMLVRYPLHSNQHAYRNGYSSDTALHSAISVMGEQLEKGGYMVGAFLDIEGAFSNTPHEVVYNEASRRGVPNKLVEWIRCRWDAGPSGSYVAGYSELDGLGG